MATTILLISLLTCLSGQDAKSAQLVRQETAPTPSACSQPAAEQHPLIREAEENQYWVRRVYFVGNEHTRDRVLRRRLINLTEGDVFTRESLVQSLESLSKLKKIIHPVTLSDITIRLDRSGKFVDMDICFTEKRR